MTYPIIIHGSENSLDRDAYIIVPEPLEQKQAKALCNSYKDLNANLLVVEDGKVAWSYKGTRDECNNSILATYGLHQQHFTNPVTQRVSRSYALKMMRTVRGLLSYLSRTQHRVQVKKALISDDWQAKLSVLKQVNLCAIEDFQKSSVVETYKFFAFQMGQTQALLQDNVELFTKNSVASHYPSLKPYVDRIAGNAAALQQFYEGFVDFLMLSCKKVEKHQLFCSNFHGCKEVFNAREERVLPRVAIFDIDGTLMDETHRAMYRESADWPTYFSLCHLDTPIEHVIELSRKHRAAGDEVWVMSGRSEVCLQATIESLARHGVEYDHIKLRGEDNFMPDYVIKPAWARKLIGLERIDVVYDDTPQVIEGFRKKGLHVVDVTKISKPLGMKQ